MKLLPASSRHLSAFALDVHHCLEETGLFSKIHIKKSGLPESGLTVICTMADSSTKQKEVAAMLERVWNETPRYGSEQDTCKITSLTGEVQMHCSTATEELRVTVHLEVLGFK